MLTECVSGGSVARMDTDDVGEYRVVYEHSDGTIHVYDSGNRYNAERSLREFRFRNAMNYFTQGPFGESWIEIRTYSPWVRVKE